MRLVENFSWLIQQLHSYDDPNVTYAKQGRKDIRGGKRIAYRRDKHMVNEKRYLVSYLGTEVITFGLTGVPIEIDKWEAVHPDFKDPELKEKYGHDKYTVMITSKNSFANGTAKRYYVSCGCKSFISTFKEKMASDEYGYTNEDGISFTNNGTKKIAPGICKHIYDVIEAKYQDVLAAEKGILDRSAVVSPAVISILFQNIEQLHSDEEQEEITQTSQTPADTGIDLATKNKRKEEYEKQIRKTLKFLSNNLSNDAKIAYKNARAAKNTTSFKKYKFSVKQYPQGWVLVFSNPELNVFTPGKGDSKEIVPIFTRSGVNLKRGAGGNSPVVVYTKYFTKDELMNMVRQETKPIQQSQIDYLTKRLGKITITESLLAELETVSSLFLEIL